MTLSPTPNVHARCLGSHAIVEQVVALREAVAAMETQLVQIKEAAAASIAGNTAASASTLVDPLELLQSVSGARRSCLVVDLIFPIREILHPITCIYV